MRTDYVFPKSNEVKFLKLAERLGYEKIVFIYNAKNFRKANIDKFRKDKFEVGMAVYSDEKNIQEAKKLSKNVVVKSYGERATFEQAPSIIFGLEENPRKDSFHFRNSGLNQVNCRIAKEKEIEIAVSFSDLLKSKNKSVALGRISQNKRFCSKYGAKFAIYSFAKSPLEMRSWHDLESLRRIL